MYDNYLYSDSSTMDLMFQGISPVLFVPLILLTLLMFICFMKMVKRRGYNPISQIIPFWGGIVRAKIATGKAVWAFCWLIPIVGWIGLIVVNFKFLHKYTRSGFVAFLGLFFPFIVVPLLAFSKYGDEEENINNNNDEIVVPLANQTIQDNPSIEDVYVQEPVLTPTSIPLPEAPIENLAKGKPEKPKKEPKQKPQKKEPIKKENSKVSAGKSYICKCKKCKKIVPNIQKGQHFTCGWCFTEQDAK